jgi:hypothetical protein
VEPRHLPQNWGYYFLGIFLIYTRYILYICGREFPERCDEDHMRNPLSLLGITVMMTRLLMP